jgi:NADH/NAD ratio-sensing transcriptional regulator Rex
LPYVQLTLLHQLIQLHDQFLVVQQELFQSSLAAFHALHTQGVAEHTQLIDLLALQLAVVHPFTPVQLQLQGPVQVTEVELQAVHRLVVGIEARFEALELPQDPLVVLFALQLAVVHPFTPVQLQLQGPVQVTEVELHNEQRLVVGIEARLEALELPQDPLVVLFALQLAVVHPFTPVQLQLQGPVQVTTEELHKEQRLAVGIDDRLEVLELPQVPLVVLLALQLAVVHPFTPVQLQLQGPVQVTEVELQAVHRLVVGIEARFEALELQHDQFVIRFALQLAVVQPLTPAQVQFHGPVQVTAVSFQVAHRFDTGTEAKDCHDEVQQDQLIDVTVFVAVQFAVVHEFIQTHVQVELDHWAGKVMLAGF